MRSTQGRVCELPDAVDGGEPETGGRGGTSGSGGSGSSADAGAAGGWAGAGTGGGGAIAGADAGTAGTTGDAGTTIVDGGSVWGAAPLSGDPCNPGSVCWTSSPIGSGTLNRAFADRFGNLYVGNGSGYVTNATGTWTVGELNSDTWAIDSDGLPHTAWIGSPAGAGLDSVWHSVWNGSGWIDSALPPVVGSRSGDHSSSWAVDLAVGSDGTPYIAWGESQVGVIGDPDFIVLSHPVDSGSWTSSDLAEPLISYPTIDVAVDDSGFWHLASTDNVVNWFTNAPSGATYVEIGGLHSPERIAMASSAGRRYLMLDVDYEYRLDGGLGADSNVVTVFELPTRSDAVGCPESAASPALSLGGTSYSLVADSRGVAHAAWIDLDTNQSPSGAFYATNHGGEWATIAVDPDATAIEVVVTPSDELYLVVQEGSMLSLLTPCRSGSS